MLRVLAASILILSFHATASECPKLSNSLEKAVTQHIHEVRAYEYCEARLTKSNQNIAIVIYTAEGQCNNNTEQPAGTCSPNWVRYMLGEYRGHLIGPVVVGGKGNLTDQEITLTDDEVTISGVTVGNHDGLCCPSVPLSKSYRVTQNGFAEFPPN